MFDQATSMVIALGNVFTTATDSAVTILIFIVTIAVTVALGTWIYKAAKALLNGQHK